MGKKSLVIYFSCGGTTELAGKELARALNCDFHPLEAQEAYTREDLDWKNPQSRSSVEMQDEKARPSYKKLPVDLKDYEQIFLGFPIWWGIEPRIIDHFIEQEDLKGKEVETLPNTNTSYDQTFNAVEQIYNDVEVLDTIIQKGFASLKEVDYVEAPLAMKAIEVKAKVTGNQLQGLSLVGLRELRLRQSAKEQAMTEVILRFIPEEQHEEVYQAIEEAEAEFYENLDLTAEDARITSALEQAGMNII